MTDRLATTLLATMILLGTLSCRTNAPSQAAAVAPEKAGEAGRQHLLMDPGWRFHLGDVNDGQAPGLDDKVWRTVDLPHDWSIEGGFDPNAPMSAAGGYLPAGVGWYRRAFTAPAAWDGQRVTIEFEGVYMNADVWLNGRHLGFHPYGYTEFRYDVTSQLKPGAVNVLAVKVDNSKHLNSRWYSGSGVYRHVWLTVTDPVHIAPWGVYVTTPDVSAGAARVQVQTRIQNDSDAERTCTLQTTLLDPNGSSVGAAKTDTSVPAHQERVITTWTSVASPTLWTPETPSLYQAVSTIDVGEKAIDEVRTTFGIRTIRISAEKGFELNGRTIKLCGGCVHHDNGCLGSAAFDRAEERRIELLKAAGFNAIRTSHNPPSTAFLDACDRLGMIVMDEAFDCWARGKNRFDYGISFRPWWPSDIEAMVLRDRNHPSIVFWSIGNEIPERASVEGARMAKMLADYVRSLDGTRFITSALNGGGNWTNMDPTFAVLDVAGYNYAMNNVPADHERVPGRVIACTESFPMAAFESWQYCQDKSYVIGDFVWTSLDYIGEAAIGRYAYSTETTPGGRGFGGFGGGTKQLYPWHNAWCGDLDLMGVRKAVSHYRNIIWGRGEKLFVGVREPQTESRTIRLGNGWSAWPTWESWTWPGFEGKNLDVEVYSSCDKVQLYLNDTLIGEKPTTRAEAFTAKFAVPYAPGKLRAVALQGDKQVAEAILTTAGDAARIRLIPDRAEITAGGQDLAFVSVEVTDKDGRLQPNAEHPIQFTITGPGVIAGVDNGSDRSEERYQSDQRKALHGRALVVIRSNPQPGEIKLTATSPGLDAVTVTIQSLAAPKVKRLE